LWKEGRAEGSGRAGGERRQARRRRRVGNDLLAIAHNASFRLHRGTRLGHFLLLRTSLSWTVGQCGESTSHDENMNCNGEQHHKQGVLSNGQPTNQQQNKKGKHPMNPRAIANLPVFLLMRGEVLHSNSWR